IDASTGHSHPAEQAADLPSLTKLPAGYLDAGSSSVQTAGTRQATSMPPGAVGHTYRNGSQLLTLTRVRAGSRSFYELSQVEATGTVLGAPAEVGGPGDGGYRCATWSDSSDTWQLCSIGIGATGQLSAAELLIIANSMR
ncbi:MAG TPA: hypothetical protein VFD94_04515, partial [Jatrophihabitans sp.]|nr:hypothetical protein [Jatrophihabitans sp.]